jgi:hypothetical protein
MTAKMTHTVKPDELPHLRKDADDFITECNVNAWTCHPRLNDCWDLLMGNEVPTEVIERLTLFFLTHRPEQFDGLRKHHRQ